MTKENTLKMLKTALEMEQKGKSFYQKAVASCHDDTGKEIFTFLMNEEIVHVGRIMKIFKNLEEGKGWNADWKEVKARSRDLTEFFSDLHKKHAPEAKVDANDLEALDIGIEFEAKAVEFYEAELPNATEDLEKDFVEMMILEEKKHLEILEDMKNYYTDPEGWNSSVDKLNYAGG